MMTVRKTGSSEGRKPLELIDAGGETVDVINLPRPSLVDKLPATGS